MYLPDGTERQNF